MEKIAIRRQEVYRYLGLGDQEPEEVLAQKIESACAQLDAVVAPKETHLRLPLHIQDETTFFCRTTVFRAATWCGIYKTAKRSFCSRPHWVPASIN